MADANKRRGILEAPRDPRENDHLYRMIVGQLLHDGYCATAVKLAQYMGFTEPNPPCGPSAELYQTFRTDLEAKNAVTKVDPYAADKDFRFEVMPETDEDDAIKFGEGMKAYEGAFHYRHERAVTSCVYSPDGKLVATGAADGRIHYHDVDRMCANISRKAEDRLEPELIHSHDVSKTAAVTAVSFHPNVMYPMVVSASDDRALR